MGKIFKMGVHVDKFIADTVHLSDDEIGKYFRFLCYAWKIKAKLPNDIKRINQIAKNPNLAKTTFILNTYFENTEEGYENKAQLEEWKYVESISEKNSINANLRWDKEKVIPPHISNNASKSKSKSYSYINIVNRWNEIIPTSHIKEFNETRKVLFRKRFKQYFNEDYEEWDKFLKRIANISFLWGDNDRGWKADFNWVLNENNYAKIIEGKYEKEDEKISVPQETKPEDKVKQWLKVIENPSPFMLSQAEKNFQEIQDLYRQKLLTIEQVKILGVRVE